jgi:hypothetical protein
VSKPTPTAPDFETQFNSNSVDPNTLPGMPGYVPPPVGVPSVAPVTPNGAGPLPPSTVPIVPPAEYGPPAPDPTDAIAAGLPPAQPGIPTRDQDQEIAPAVPREAPGNVGTPGAPIAQPPEATPGTTADVKDAQDKEKAAREESEKAQTDQMAAGQDVAAAQAEAAQKREAIAAEHIKQAQVIQDQYDQADKSAQAQVAQTQQALKDFKFKDYWADKSSAQRVLSSLGVALGAFGAGLTKTPNYALEILNRDMDRDHQQQVEHLNQLTNEEVMARTGIDDSRAARQRAMADLTLTDAAKDKMIASQLETAAAKSTDENYRNTVTAQVAKLHAEAAAKNTDAVKQLRTMNLGDQQAALAAKKEASEEEARRAQEEYERQHGAYWANGGAKGKHGSGGGAGGSSIDKSAVTLASEIEAAKKNGQPMSYADMAARAAELKIPLKAKAGHTSLETVISDSGKLATNENRDAGRGLKADRLLETQVKNFATEHQLPKLESSARKLQEVRSMLDSGNPVAAMSALMEYDAAAKGSSATESSMHAIQGRLGGAWDRFKGAVARQDSGAFGDTERQNLKGAIDAGIKSFKESIEPIHKAFGEKFDYSKPGVQQAAGGLFGPLGYHKGAAAAGESDLVKKARAAANDPNRRPEVRAAAQKILAQQGASGG